MNETATVTFTVFSMERLHGLGRLVGLANVEVVVDGVAITVQGVRILQRPKATPRNRRIVWLSVGW